MAIINSKVYGNLAWIFLNAGAKFSNRDNFDSIVNDFLNKYGSKYDFTVDFTITNELITDITTFVNDFIKSKDFYELGAGSITSYSILPTFSGGDTLIENPTQYTRTNPLYFNWNSISQTLRDITLTYKTVDKATSTISSNKYAVATLPDAYFYRDLFFVEADTFWYGFEGYNRSGGYVKTSYINTGVSATAYDFKTVGTQFSSSGFVSRIYRKVSTINNPFLIYRTTQGSNNLDINPFANNFYLDSKIYDFSVNKVLDLSKYQIEVPCGISAQSIHPNLWLERFDKTTGNSLGIFRLTGVPVGTNSAAYLCKQSKIKYIEAVSTTNTKISIEHRTLGAGIYTSTIDLNINLLDGNLYRLKGIANNTTYTETVKDAFVYKIYSTDRENIFTNYNVNKLVIGDVYSTGGINFNTDDSVEISKTNLITPLLNGEGDTVIVPFTGNFNLKRKIKSSLNKSFKLNREVKKNKTFNFNLKRIVLFKTTINKSFKLNRRVKKNKTFNFNLKRIVLFKTTINKSFKLIRKVKKNKTFNFNLKRGIKKNFKVDFNLNRVVSKKNLINVSFKLNRKIKKQKNYTFKNSRKVLINDIKIGKLNREVIRLIFKPYNKEFNLNRKVNKEIFYYKEFDLNRNILLFLSRSFNLKRETTILSLIKIILNINGTDKDAVLDWYINKAITDISMFCNIPIEEFYNENVLSYMDVINSFDVRLKHILVDLVIYYYQMRGSEHLNSENLGGGSWSYSLDIPPAIQARLKSFKRLGKLNVF